MRVARDNLGRLEARRRRVAAVRRRRRSCSKLEASSQGGAGSLFLMPAKRLQAFIVQPDKSPSLTWWQRQDAAEAVSNTGRIKGV